MGCWGFGEKETTESHIRRIQKGDIPHVQDPGVNESKDAPLSAAEIAIEKYPDNLIVTSRYTLWNFLPKNLFEQFRRIVNFYFLVVAFIQTIIDSPVHPMTAVSPLAFVIFVTAIKQGYEDWLRHKNDDQVNNRPVRVVRDGILEEIKSKDIQVGDVIKLVSEDQVPTDILLLGSSDEYLRCQINTANLDGETNLKLRYCPSGLPHFKSEEDFQNLHMIVECEQPNEDLYDFNGSLFIPSNKLSAMHWSPADSATNVVESDKLEHHGADSSGGLIRQGMTDFLSIPLSMENVVLRGTRLKNTDFIYGLVVYSGRDTRLAKNSEKSEAKFSTIEHAVNLYLIFFIIALVFIVIFCTLMHYFKDWYADLEDGDYPWYSKDHEEERHDVKKILNTIASFTILFNYIIPISLYVTVELQKFLGSKFFVWDNEMVDEEGREPLCNTSDLNEELGQIEYLFSDKTGTLTQNIMQFRYCSIGTVRYEYKSNNRLYYASSAEDQPYKDGAPADLLSPETIQFFKTLALCHSVQVVPKRKASFDAGSNSEPLLSLPVMRINKKEKKSEIHGRRTSLITQEPPASDVAFDHGSWEFQASSPDEKALLESCDRLGVTYLGEKEDVLTLDVAGITEKYKRLMHLEFDADRKCMSVIVENSKGEIWLLSKGAESSIIPKCDAGPTHETLKHVMDYALMGLRTLAVSVRNLSRKEYDDFTSDLRAARRLIKNRQQKVREVYSSIEVNMTLIGVTGVEDQLQENVPETLQAFAAAGIRVWMLTGDKLETGVNVAVSCGLITASTDQYIVSKEGGGDGIVARLNQIKGDMDVSDNTCFVIDGDSLSLAFKECPELLCEVSMTAFRVVCCRMAPLQKAQVVQMVRNSPRKPTCCAVGDGANDCAMILAAHIGIGILGKEGRQAARCADFAVAKFGFLRRAILVHGHWFYVRLANVANYFFYKNVIFILPQLLFCFHTNFSTQALFNAIFLTMHNLFFTACPIFYYGLTEQPFAAETLMNYPELYSHNRKNAAMNGAKFLPWFLSAIWHAFVCFYLPYYAWDNFSRINDLASFGTVVYCAVLIVSNLKMLVETIYISGWYIGAHIYSYSTMFVFTTLFSEFDFRSVGLDPAEFRHVFFTVLSSTSFWLLMGLVSVASMIPDVAYVAIRNSLDSLDTKE